MSKYGLSKEQIEEYGLEPFIKHCKESVWKYKVDAAAAGNILEQAAG